ncbi:MAG: SIS domain-containing protein, partial [Chloroflexota bacterium]
MTDSLLLSEIHAQPAVLRRLLAAEAEHVRQIAAKVRAANPRFVVLAARGTSDNAARYAAYLFGAHNRLPVVLALPSLYTQYHAPPRMEGALVIGVSQSGASPDLVAVVAEGKRQGCATLAITNIADSPITQVADDVIWLRAGAEQSIAATKTYTAQLFALAMLSSALAESDTLMRQLARVPEMVAAALAPLSHEGRGDGLPRVLGGGGEGVSRAAELLKGAAHCVVIGRGFNFATAFEIALKAKELAHVAAEPYSSADFLHGPIALVAGGFHAIGVVMDGAVADDVHALLAEMKQRGAQPIIISNREESLRLAAAPIALPADIPEWLSPIVAVVPGQLLAYHLSVARGFDPDHPRGIQKVTRTM